MKKVKALQTLHGSYGLKKVDDEFEVQNSFADDMAERGLVEIIGEEEETEKKEVKKAEDKETTEKVNIADNTTKEKRIINKPGKAK